MQPGSSGQQDWHRPINHGATGHSGIFWCNENNGAEAKREPWSNKGEVYCEGMFLMVTSHSMRQASIRKVFLPNGWACTCSISCDHSYMLSVQERTWPTVSAGWQLWIPAHAINFGFIAPSMRVLYVNVVAVSLFCSPASSL